MRGLYPVEQVRAAEAALMATLPGGELMRRASHGLSIQCERLLGRVYGSRVVLLVGSGANGGDALHAGARLARLGARVHAVLLEPDRTHQPGLADLRGSGGRVLAGIGVSGGDAVELIDGAGLVLDGIVGIGGRGGLRPVAAGLAEAARRAPSARTVAVDLPSGVDADTGVVDGAAIVADVTVTFGALKRGLVCGEGAIRAGEVRLVDIGLEPYLPESSSWVLEADDVAGLVPPPGPTDDKYTRGVVGVVAGSPQYGGAGVLATGAALHGGAGMVRYLGLAPEQIRARYPEVVVHPVEGPDGIRPGDVRVQSWVIGPGLGTGADATALLAEVLATDVPVIVDADAITVLAREPGMLRGRSAPTVLTPHDREFQRLPVELDADRAGSASRAAAELGVIMLLKGDATVVADPDGSVYVNRTGTPWLGTAGSGDVLSGLIGALLARGLRPGLAAATGAYLHGVAGQLAASAGPPSASDVLASLRAALGAVRH